MCAVPMWFREVEASRLARNYSWASWLCVVVVVVVFVIVVVVIAVPLWAGPPGLHATLLNPHWSLAGFCGLYKAYCYAPCLLPLPPNPSLIYTIPTTTHPGRGSPGPFTCQHSHPKCEALSMGAYSYTTFFAGFLFVS